MARVGDELALAGEGPIQSFEHGIEGVGEFAHFVAGPVQRDALGQVPLTCCAGGRGDLTDRAQDAPRNDPAGDRSQKGDADQGEQRVGE